MRPCGAHECSDPKGWNRSERHQQDRDPADCYADEPLWTVEQVRDHTHPYKILTSAVFCAPHRVRT